MIATAHIELFAGCLRVFAPGSKYGDEYVFSCSLHWLSCEEVELKGITSCAKSPIGYRHAIRDILINHGVKVLRWERKGCGEERLIRVDISTGRILKGR